MITKTQALALGYGDVVHFTGRHDCSRTTGPRGGMTERITRAKVTGAVQTWKTRPAEFRVPVKAGMRDYGAIHHYDAGNWHLAAECPLQQVETGA